MMMMMMMNRDDANQLEDELLFGGTLTRTGANIGVDIGADWIHFNNRGQQRNRWHCREIIGSTLPVLKTKWSYMIIDIGGTRQIIIYYYHWW